LPLSLPAPLLALALLAPAAASAFTIDATWDVDGLQICSSATAISIDPHPSPPRLRYTCLMPSAAARTCHMHLFLVINPDVRLMTVKCTTTPPPPPDPARIHIASFEHRERADF
jgi:hypothetical protein